MNGSSGRVGVVTGAELVEYRAQAEELYDASSYDYVGVRVMAPTMKGYNARVGTIAPESKFVDGVAAIDATGRRTTTDLGTYHGNRVFILGSNSATFGQDPGEIVMREPKILRIINVKRGKK